MKSLIIVFPSCYKLFSNYLKEGFWDSNILFERVNSIKWVYKVNGHDYENYDFQPFSQACFPWGNYEVYSVFWATCVMK